MNDLEYRYVMEELQRKQNKVNREAWKYQSFYQYQTPLIIRLIKSLLKSFTKKHSVSCCEC
ncbi:Uncharacterised protein [Bacillus freudenreichii]|nr:Uncharacterised protein [Bacillus freudenreichii]